MRTRRVDGVPPLLAPSSRSTQHQQAVVDLLVSRRRDLSLARRRRSVSVSAAITMIAMIRLSVLRSSRAAVASSMSSRIFASAAVSPRAAAFLPSAATTRGKRPLMSGAFISHSRSVAGAARPYTFRVNTDIEIKVMNVSSRRYLASASSSDTSNSIDDDDDGSDDNGDDGDNGDDSGNDSAASNAAAPQGRAPAASARTPATTAKTTPTRRLAEFDSLFFDTVDKTSATSGRSSSSRSPPQQKQQPQSAFRPTSMGNRTASATAAASPAAAAAAASNINAMASTSRSFTPKNVPRATTAPTASAVGRPRATSRPAAAATGSSTSNSSRYVQPGQRAQAGGASSGDNIARAMPPPMEYDYDYYDDEMGISGTVGLLGGDDEPYDPNVIDIGTPPRPPLAKDSVVEPVTSGEDASLSINEKDGVVQDEQQEMIPDASASSLKQEPSVGAAVAAPSIDADTPRHSDSDTVDGPASASIDRFAEIMDTPAASKVPSSMPKPSQNVAGFMAESSNGNGKMTQIDILASKVETIKNDIYAENGAKEFNINSFKQVAEILFGDKNESTNKDVLDAMAGAGNRMADLILQYRQAQSDLKRAKKLVENKENGIHVDDFHKSAPDGGKEKQLLEFEDANDSNPLLLVDASAYIFRAYYSMPPLHRSDGTPVGAVRGFCNMLDRLVLNRLLDGGQPRIVLVFDSKGKTFRHDIYPDYKANRGPCPVDLVPQFDLIREAADAYGIDQIEATTYEADDVIATLATMAQAEGINVHVLSGDKDLMQLVTPPDEKPSINMIDPKENILYSYDVVVEKWGVPPALLGDVLALTGDSSDNIPGVPGIGPVYARDFINEFGSLEALLERADEIKQKGRRKKVVENIDKARLSRKLVELDTTVPIESMTLPDHYTSVSELKMAPFSSDKLLAFYEEMEFKEMIRRLKERLNINGNNINNASDGRAGTDTNGTLLEKSESDSPVQSTGPIATSGTTGEEIVSTSNAALNENIRAGLIMHNKRRKAPPRPEDFSDVPF